MRNSDTRCGSPKSQKISVYTPGDCYLDLFTVVFCDTAHIRAVGSIMKGPSKTPQKQIVEKQNFLAKIFSKKFFRKKFFQKNFFFERINLRSFICAKLDIFTLTKKKFPSVVSIEGGGRKH